MAIGEQAVESSPDELLSVSALGDGHGLEIVDHIERRHVTVRTGSPVSPTRCSPDRFEFPVGRAVVIETDSLNLPQQVGMLVRNSLGFIVDEVTKGTPQSFPRDEYSLDPGAPIKLYLRFDAAFEVGVSEDGIQIDLDSRSTVYIGARSHHKQPAATITTTADVRDAMKAVSAFGSALKTTSCERSYPTLRGHPPTLQFGDDLSIPGVLDQPETGITIEVPTEFRSLFPCSSLAYYLGAEVVPGGEPLLVTENGLEYPLATQSVGLEERIERLLKRCFFLDCLTRTEGFFQVNLHERNVVEDRLDLDFAELYTQPVSTQLETYLEVPYSLLRDQTPKWKLVSHVPPEASSLETLPFLANDLSVIKVIDGGELGRSKEGPVSCDGSTEGAARRTGARSSADRPPTPSTVSVEDANAMEQAWLGEGAPMGVSKAMVEAFNNRLGRTLADGDIDITVICNAAEMGQERDIVDDVYASREELPFDVTIQREVTTGEMRRLLERDTDFLHYIGHIDAGGFECSDGRFDVQTLDHTGVDVFFLNACSSYGQGKGLIEAGSIAGVVTLEDVINSGAERVGMTLARLLNWGFPLRPAMNIARSRSIMGGHYLVLGDGGVDIAQPEKGFLGLCDLTNRGNDWLVKFTSYPTKNRGLGSVIKPHLSEYDEFFLISGETDTFVLTDGELHDLLSIDQMPIHYDGELTWSSEFVSKVV